MDDVEDEAEHLSDLVVCEAFTCAGGVRRGGEGRGRGGGEGGDGEKKGEKNERGRTDDGKRCGCVIMNIVCF